MSMCLPFLLFQPRRNVDFLGMLSLFSAVVGIVPYSVLSWQVALSCFFLGRIAFFLFISQHQFRYLSALSDLCAIFLFLCALLFFSWVSLELPQHFVRMHSSRVWYAPGFVQDSEQNIVCFYCSMCSWQVRRLIFLSVVAVPSCFSWQKTAVLAL